MDALTRLVELKRQESELAATIKQAQEEAIAFCQEQGIKGRQVVGDDAVTFKVVTGAPKPTDEVLEMRSRADELDKAIQVLNKDAIDALNKQIDALGSQVGALSSTEESMVLRTKARALMDVLPKVTTYQVAVSLKK